MLGNAGLIGGEVPIKALPDGGGAVSTLGAEILGALAGVAGLDVDGDALSVTHMRWLVVATSFATVWARVEYGLT